MVVDAGSLATGLALFKSGMDGFRSAIAAFKEIRNLAPTEKQAEFDKAIEQSEKQFKIAEAQIAQGLGYKLCH